MLPVRVRAATGVYGAPRGGVRSPRRPDDRVGPAAAELAALNAGGVIVLGIHGMEPIPPVDVAVARDDPDGVRDPRAEIVP